MRQLILFFAFVFYFNFCFSQGTPAPNYQSFGSQTTLTDFKGIARGVKGIIVGRYADTTTANLGFADFYPGAQIITDSPRDVLWQRNYNATAWIQTGSVNNIINNSTTTVSVLNDSTIIICNGDGTCDTIVTSSTNISNAYYINDSMVVACDTPQVIVVGDTATVQQVCDTINVPRSNLYIFQNWTTQISNGIVEFGGDLNHNTIANTQYSHLNIKGRPVFSELVLFENEQHTTYGTTIVSFRSQGSGDPTAQDFDNLSRLYINYSNKINPTDNMGYLGDAIGYMINGNGRGVGPYGLQIDNPAAKIAGLFVHTDETLSTDGVTIFAAPPPNSWSYSVPIYSGNTLLGNRVASFKTDNKVQFYSYGDGVFTGTATYLIASDVNGNLIEYPSGGLPGGGALITADNGITANTATNVQLGGDLLHSTIINGGALYNLTMTGTGAAAVLNANNTGAGHAFRASSPSGIAVQAVSTGGIAIAGSANNAAISGYFLNWNTTVGNTVADIVKISKQSAVAGAAGNGGSILFTSSNSISGDAEVSRITAKLTTATNGAEIGSLQFDVVDGGGLPGRKSVLLGSGQWQWDTYGSGTFTGTATKWLAVTSTGLVIEEAAPSSVNIYNSDGTLDGTRIVSTAGFNTTWTGSNATNALFQITNSSSASGAYGLGVTGSANVAAISATNVGTGGGVQGTSASSTGIIGISTTGLGGAFNINPSSTNTVANIIEITRTSSGAAANGIGGRIQFTVENSGGGTRLAAALDAIFTEITDATRMSDFAISTVNSGTTTESVRFIGQGAMKLRSITATAASAITAADGMIVYVSTTDGTFTSVGFWGREGGAWVKL